MRFTRVVASVVAAVVVLLAAGCGRAPSRPTGKMTVAASIAPLYSFAQHVGGKYVAVELLVPPGSNPHTYSVQPDQMQMLSDASVLVLNGVHLEYWADKAVSAAGNPKLIVVETGKGLRTIASREEDGGNPHVWLDPIYAIHQVQRIRDAFIEADPRHKAAYTANAARYVAQLRKLDEDVRAQTSRFRSKEFIAAHPTWAYFARRYGLKEAAVIEESPGKEPSPAKLKQIVQIARRIHAKAIFAEPQTSPKGAQVVASEVGANVLLLNAMGEPPNYDYETMMRTNLDAIAGALR